MYVLIPQTIIPFQLLVIKCCGCINHTNDNFPSNYWSLSAADVLITQMIIPHQPVAHWEWLGVVYRCIDGYVLEYSG